MTGEIWRAANKKPDGETRVNSVHTGEPLTKIGQSVQPKCVNPYSVDNVVRPEVAKFDHEMYKRYVLPNDKGEQRDMLFGHGLDLDEFHRRQLATAYDLSYNQQVMPQTQVNSFYNPDPTQTAKKYHR